MSTLQLKNNYFIGISARLVLTNKNDGKTIDCTIMRKCIVLKHWLLNMIIKSIVSIMCFKQLGKL